MDTNTNDKHGRYKQLEVARFVMRLSPTNLLPIKCVEFNSNKITYQDTGHNDLVFLDNSNGNPLHNIMIWHAICISLKDELFLLPEVQAQYELAPSELTDATDAIIGLPGCATDFVRVDPIEITWRIGERAQKFANIGKWQLAVCQSLMRLQQMYRMLSLTDAVNTIQGLMKENKELREKFDNEKKRSESLRKELTRK